MQNDLINGKTAQEIKDRLKACSEVCACRLCKYDNTKCHLGVVFGDALALIEQLERKPGKWLRDGSLGHIGDYCSNCDSRQKPGCGFKFCPDCGTRMDGEAE